MQRNMGKYLEMFDIIGLTETWTEEVMWKKMKPKIPSEFEWFSVTATKNNKKGRAKDGVLVAANKEIKNIKAREINKGTIEINLVHNGKKWRIIILYSKNIKETLEEVMEEIKEEKEKCLGETC